MNLITTVEQWDQKMAEAKKDGKVVSLSTFSLSREMRCVELYLVVHFHICDMLGPSQIQCFPLVMCIIFRIWNHCNTSVIIHKI